MVDDFRDKQNEWAKNNGIEISLLDTFREIQRELKEQIIIPSDDQKFKTPKYIGGLDISFSKKMTTKATVAITVYEYEPFLKKSTKNIDPIYKDVAEVELTLPYIPGFLGFRELPHYSQLIEKLKKDRSEIFPDIFLIDGNGILHCNGVGSACHLGVTLDVATIGISKTFFNIDGLNEDMVKDKFAEECNSKGDFSKIIGKSGKSGVVH